MGDASNLMSLRRLMLVVLAALALVQAGGCEVNAVPDDPNDVRPLLPGMKAPRFEATTSDGNLYAFDPDLIDRPLVVTFYRGGWCPYCSKHLMAYREVEEKLVEMGYEVLFISPDRPEVSAEKVAGGDFDFILLSDSDMTITSAFGLTFRLDDVTFTRYIEEFGIDIEGDSGQTHHYLPVPATYIIGKDGVIRFMYANLDYKVRVAPELLATAARLALEE